MSQRNSFHVITIGDRQFEVWAPDEKSATRCARFKEWAGSKSHLGLRRILRTIPGQQYPVLVEEANYFAALRAGAEKKRADEALRKQATAESLERRAKAQAAEDAAYAQRLETMRVEREIRRKKLEALDARLGRSRLLPNLPTYDPEKFEWI